VGDAFARTINNLDEEAFQALYGRWDPLQPAQVAELFPAVPVRWWIAGGRAARAGAPARQHEDTDVAVRIDDLGLLRAHLSGWHLWETRGGTLRPLLPGDDLTPGCDQLWARRDAQHPWRLDLLLDRSQDEWVFKLDPRIRVPWQEALHTVDGIPHLRPELALLHKAHLDRPKDRADLAAARLGPGARAWLTRALEQLGQHAWAEAARSGTGTPTATTCQNNSLSAPPRRPAAS
jgi:hypothetical protein